MTTLADWLVAVIVRCLTAYFEIKVHYESASRELPADATADERIARVRDAIAGLSPRDRHP